MSKQKQLLRYRTRKFLQHHCMSSEMSHQQPRLRDQSPITASTHNESLSSLNFQTAHWLIYSVLYWYLTEKTLPLAQSSPRWGCLMTWHLYGSPDDCCHYRGDNQEHEQLPQPHWTSQSNQIYSCILFHLHSSNVSITFTWQQHRQKAIRQWSSWTHHAVSLPGCLFASTRTLTEGHHSRSRNRSGI